MRKTLKTKKLLFPLVMASVSVLVGCTNSDYDFNEIDMTLGLGGGELVIPTSSTKEIALDDILKLEEGESVRILDNGDYAFVQDANTVVTNVNVEKVSLTGHPIDDNEIKLNLKDLIENESYNSARAGENYVTIKTQNPVKMLEYDYEAKQDEIKSITEAKVTAEMFLTVIFSQALAQNITTIDELTWVLPDYMETDNGTNIVKLEDVKNGHTEPVKINKINFKDSELKCDDGIALDIEVKLSINTKVPVDKLQNIDEWNLSANFMLNEITINEVVGKFEPDIDLNDLGDVEINDTPDFLKEDGVNVDLANPQIIVKVDNRMNVPAYIVGELIATKDGRDKTVKIPEKIELSPTTENLICICRDKKLVDEKYKDYTKYEVSDLSELISTIPDRIRFIANTEANHDVDASFKLGTDYAITTSYHIEAPIAFGENANIVYTDSIVDIHGELDGFELSEGAYLEVTANVVNNLPIFLSTKVTPLGVDENDLSGDLKVTVEDNLPAAKDGEAAQGTLKIKLEGDIQQLDKLMFTISGKAKDGTDKVTGVTLNKNIHSLKLDNVNAKIVGTVIYDAN